MTTKKKGKPMSQREKLERARIRAELREKGIIPPVKPRLNRKKFAQEVEALWDAEMGDYGASFYLSTVIGFTIGSIEGSGRVTEEDVGVLKLMRAAIAYRRLSEAATKSGEPLTIGALHDGIKGIMGL